MCYSFQKKYTSQAINPGRHQIKSNMHICTLQISGESYWNKWFWTVRKDSVEESCCMFFFSCRYFWLCDNIGSCIATLHFLQYDRVHPLFFPGDLLHVWVARVIQRLGSQLKVYRREMFLPLAQQAAGKREVAVMARLWGHLLNKLTSIFAFTLCLWVKGLQPVTLTV